MKRIRNKILLLMAIISIAVGISLPAMAAILSPAVALSYSTGQDDPLDLEISHDRAYIAAGDSGIHIVNTNNLRLISIISTKGSAEAVFVNGGYAYVACGEAGLEIIDLQSPHLEHVISDTPGYAKDISVYGDYAYVADAYAGLQIIDVSDKKNPVLVREFFYDDNDQTVERATRHMKDTEVCGVFVSWPYVYLVVQNTGNEAKFGGGLRVLGVTDPLAVELSVLNPDEAVPDVYSVRGRATSVYVINNTAYLTSYDPSNGTSFLRRIDVSDPSAPSRPSSQPYEFPVNGNAMDVYVIDSTAYVAAYHGGLHIIDTSASGLIDIIKTEGSAISVRIVDDMPYVCQGAAGSFAGLIAYGQAGTGDLNADSEVDLEDYAILADSWQKNAVDMYFNPAADIDKDGDVDIADYKIFIIALRGSNPNDLGDFNGDGLVNLADAEYFSVSFEKGIGMPDFNPYADLDEDPDGMVLGSDSAIFIEYWRPKQPQDFSMEAYSSSEVLYSWSEVPNADYYTPKVMDEAGQFKALLDENGKKITVPHGQTTYLLDGLDPSTDVLGVVTAENGGGESADSYPAGTRTAALTNMPPVISDALPAHKAIVQGKDSFEPIDLKQYVVDDNTEAADIIWEPRSDSFSSVLNVSIDDDNIAIVSLNNTGFTGSETIELTAIDDDHLESEPRQITFTIGTLDADSSAIQALIGEAQINDVVDVPAGIYTFSSNLLIEQNIHLRGTGADSTIFELGDYCIDIMMPQGYDGFYTYRTPGRINPLTNVTLEGITIRGGRRCPSESRRWVQEGYGMTGYGGGHWETIKYPYGKAPVHNYSRKLTVYNCKIIDNRGKKASAIYTGVNTQLDIINSLIYDNEHPPSSITVRARRGNESRPLMQRLDGAIYVDRYAKLRVVSSTIAGNGDGLGYNNRLYGAIAKDMYATVSIVNSILWGNGTRGQELSCDKWRMPGVHIGKTVLDPDFDINGRLDDFCTKDRIYSVNPPFIDGSMNTRDDWYSSYGAGSRF